MKDSLHDATTTIDKNNDNELDEVLQALMNTTFNNN